MQIYQLTGNPGVVKNDLTFEIEKALAGALNK